MSVSGINQVVNLFIEMHGSKSHPKKSIKKEPRFVELIEKDAEVRSLSKENATPIIERLAQLSEDLRPPQLIEALKASAIMGCHRAFENLLYRAKNSKWVSHVPDLMEWMIKEGFKKEIEITCGLVNLASYNKLGISQQPLLFALEAGRMDLFTYFWKKEVGTKYKDELLQNARENEQVEIAQFIEDAKNFPSPIEYHRMKSGPYVFQKGVTVFMDSTLDDHADRMRSIDFSRAPDWFVLTLAHFIANVRRTNALRGFLESNVKLDELTLRYLKISVFELFSWEEGAKVLVETNKIDFGDLDKMGNCPEAFALALKKVPMDETQKKTLLEKMICILDYPSLIPAFKEAGFDLSAEVADSTLLRIAISLNRSQLLHALIDVGVDIHSEDDWEMNYVSVGLLVGPLNIAKFRYGEESEMYQLLLKAHIKQEQEQTKAG